VAFPTIYNGAFEDPDHTDRARIALMISNDVILRVAFEGHASVIDSRLVCSERGPATGDGGAPKRRADLRLCWDLAEDLLQMETGATTSTVLSAGIDRDRHRGPRRPRVRKAKPDIRRLQTLRDTRQGDPVRAMRRQE
jgi:hypothetical protein